MQRGTVRARFSSRDGDDDSGRERSEDRLAALLEDAKDEEIKRERERERERERDGRMQTMIKLMSMIGEGSGAR